jgi:hypothetical protein
MSRLVPPIALSIRIIHKNFAWGRIPASSRTCDKNGRGVTIIRQCRTSLFASSLAVPTSHGKLRTHGRNGKNDTGYSARPSHRSRASSRQPVRLAFFEASMLRRLAWRKALLRSCCRRGILGRANARNDTAAPISERGAPAHRAPAIGWNKSIHAGNSGWQRPDPDRRRDSSKILLGSVCARNFLVHEATLIRP